jgi:hypothetical protein
MGGISVTLEGDNIQLSFQKGHQTTAVVMDAGAARSLVRALGQLLATLDDEEEAPGESDETFLDVTSPSIDVGTDDRGQPVVALQAGSLPPFMLRLRDEEARHIANSLLEILNAPRDVRTSHGDH